ncbi:unnamed protein product [Soboliphyme baturini]|uniref:G_PROTEIN_RECEP_F1_2 domain-containing protein n=1 Tax=Soboliphyme baturini TaxID=241478 RepID=A0A183J045_9BILA|nr:unnamed protein product [Soboliphyme baturini]
MNVTDGWNVNTVNVTVDELMEWRKSAYAITVPVFITICLMVMVSNLFVLLPLMWVRYSPTATIRLTVSLAISDVWTSSVVAFSLVYNSYLYAVYEFPVSACVALSLEAVRTGGLLTGCLHLLALAVNHYLLIAYPFLYGRILNRRNTIAVIVLLWILPPLAFFVYFSSINDQGYRSPSGDCDQVLFYHQLEFRLAISLLILLFIVIMSVFYVAVVVILAKSERRFAHSRAHADEKQLRRNRRTLVTTLIIVGTFLVGWMPVSMIFVLTCETCALPYSATSAHSLVFFTSVLANLCILLKSLVNPIVYAVRIPEIQNALRKFLRRNGTANDFRATTCANLSNRREEVTLLT